MTRLEALEEVAKVAKDYSDNLFDGHECPRDGCECDGCRLRDALKKLRATEAPSG